jgi:hypothetical protein
MILLVCRGVLLSLVSLVWLAFLFLLLYCIGDLGFEREVHFVSACFRKKNFVLVVRVRRLKRENLSWLACIPIACIILTHVILILGFSLDHSRDLAW